jgi:F-box-like
MSIESLPDDVLLEIFCQVRFSKPYHRWHLDWPKLVHVCQRWRFVIFASPLRLKLQLFCTPKTPVRKLLNIWPTLPLVVKDDWKWSSEDKFENFIDALEHRDRVQEIKIGDPRTQDGFWERTATAMQEPFPELTTLSLQSFSGVLPLPNSFLNGSASRLQHLLLREISFPSLPQFLLTTRDLTSLRLGNIPNSGYIPPETMATSLSVLPRLERLTIGFQTPTPDPQRRNRPLPPQTRFVLPALIQLQFRGVSEYLEVLVARIDAPLLKFDHFRIVFFHQLVFDIPQTIRFFGHLGSFRTFSLTLRFDTGSISLAVFCPSDMPGQSWFWHIRCNTFDRQLVSITQICSQIRPFRSSVESLVIDCTVWSVLPETEIDPTLWLQLFHSFPSVQRLQITSYFERSIAAALGRLTGGSAANVFPSLHSLVIVTYNVFRHIDTAPPLDGIRSFVAAHQHSGHPVAVSRRK